MRFSRAIAGLVVLWAAPALAGQEGQYRVKRIVPPELKRPAVEVSRQDLPQGATGVLPSFDGEPFHLNLKGTGEQASEDLARRAIGQVAKAIRWNKVSEELSPPRREIMRGATPEAAERAARSAAAETSKRQSGRLGPLSPSTQRAVEERVKEARDLATRSQEVVSFEQRVGGVRVEESGAWAIFQQGRGLVALRGRLFSTVNPSNRRRISEAEAVAAARAHVSRTTKLDPKAGQEKPELVLLPYGDSFRFAWRADVAAEEGSYRLWIDAESRAPLRLEPQFAPNSATGLAFTPSPAAGTAQKSFEVNAPSGGNYSLVFTGRADCNNAGADGTAGDLAIASGGSTSANFDAAPINGTVVERTNQASYNGRFQEVNAYAWVFDNMQTLDALGSRTFPSVTVTVNHNNPCGFGMDNACGGASAVTYGIGTATTSTSTAPGALFNSAIDATVVTHEFGHVINRLQLTGINVGALDEGVADFWAATLHGTDTFGGWWKHNGGSTPVQTGFVPRQADPLDVFPEHRAFSQDSHADGQIIDWALWSTRQGLNGPSVLGTFVVNVSLVKALTTASAALSGGSTDKGVHDAYLDLLQNLTAQITSSTANKLLAGFARAGITLSERDAVIDIDDDYLARGSASGPTFTVFGGRDYQFSGQTAVAGNFFNSRFQIEVANDAAFTTAHVTSPWINAIAVDARGVPLATWTLPVADWNTVKGGNALYYRVTTSDAAGGQARVSTSPGNGFVTVPVPYATINTSGQCECACATVAAPPGGGRGLGWITLAPLLAALAWRLRLRQVEAS